MRGKEWSRHFPLTISHPILERKVESDGGRRGGGKFLRGKKKKERRKPEGS